MALGNANTSAQSRGKNKPVIVKRIKEVVAAKGFATLLGSLPQRASACSLSTASLNIKYVHDGSGTLPSTGDKLYSKSRVNDRFLLEAGHYKVVSGKSICSVEINGSGVVAAVTICKS
tara:strand:+ start:349 stop:702 length:354 start_codon:yes stop_codon:yes gene_type:complete